jgi:hypothetical protein
MVRHEHPYDGKSEEGVDGRETVPNLRWSSRKLHWTARCALKVHRRLQLQLQLQLHLHLTYASSGRPPAPPRCRSSMPTLPRTGT